MSEDSIRSVRFTGQIWSVVVDHMVKVLYLDIKEGDQRSIVRFDLKNFKHETKLVEWSKWVQLVGASKDVLNFIDYKDPNDPNDSEQFNFDWFSSKKSRGDIEIEKGNEIYPHIYEHGSEYHKTVAKFLAFDLPLSCEYLEWSEKIIISYYLRSNNDFKRHLLLIREGKKEWKVLQDDQMKGFAPGSFFVFEDQLIFIKDQNEICVYAD